MGAFDESPDTVSGVLGSILRHIQISRLYASPRERLLSSWNVELDPEVVHEATAAAVPVEIPLGDRRVPVQLRDSATIHPKCELVDVLDDRIERRPLDFRVEPLEGDAIDVADPGYVRLTVCPRWVAGWMRIGCDNWLIWPSGDPQRRTNDQHTVCRFQDVHFVIQARHDNPLGRVESHGPVPHAVGPEVGMTFLADDLYEAQASFWGVPGYALQTVLLNNVNGIYRRSVGAWFSARRFIRVHGLNSLRSTNASILLHEQSVLYRQGFGDLTQVSVRMESGIEINHFTTGRNLDGNIIGFGQQPGVYSLSQQQGSPFLLMPPSVGSGAMLLMAHEVGHNFDGAHEAADKWCEDEFLGLCFDTDETIMWPELSSGTEPFFSDGTRETLHNNRQRIMNNMARGRNANYSEP